jgi:hypothetical protein
MASIDPECAQVNEQCIPLENLVVNDCQNTHNFIECQWIDPNNSQFTIGESVADSWTSSLFRWKFSSLHEPFEIANGINYRESSAVDSLSIANESIEFFHGYAIPFMILTDSSKDGETHLKNLLRSIGNISFIPFTRAEDVDLKSLVESGRIEQAVLDRLTTSDGIPPGDLERHIARALAHLDAIKAGSAAGYGLFGIAETNLMLAGSPSDVGFRIKRALQQYPPTADMLYLEACHEHCSERTFSIYYPHWARTTGSLCSAAVLLTRKGARRIAALTGSLWATIDHMLASMIRAGLLEAYVLTPTALFQDGYWPSDSPWRPGRRHGDRAWPGVTHRPYAVVCREMADALRLVHVQISPGTEYLRRCFSPGGPHRAGPAATVLVISDLLADDVEGVGAITYYTRAAGGAGGSSGGAGGGGGGGGEDAWVQVGEWPQAWSPHMRNDHKAVQSA